MCTSQPVSPIVHYRDSNIPTIADIRNKWCFGLPLCNTSGNVITDEAIEHFIYAAIKNVERKLGVFLKPTIIVTNPLERGLVEGFDYEVAEPAYDYDAKAYANWGFLQLRERHVQSLQSLKLVLPNGQIIVDFLTRPEWVKLYPKEAQIQIVPYAGDPTVFYLLGGSQAGFPFVTGQINRNMPQMWYIDYIAGYPLKQIPCDTSNIIAKIAAVDILGIAGDAFKAGIANTSTSIDGLSESMGSTVSATSTLYQAHINQYQQEIDKFFSIEGDAARTVARGFTFTVL